MNYVIARPPNGISLNGNDEGNVWTFDNRNDALNFIHNNDLDLEDVSVKPYSQEKHIL